MKAYTVDSASAVYRSSVQETETTDTNHASNINAGPRQIFENTVANRRDIKVLQKALAAAQGGAAADLVYKTLVAEATTKAEVDGLFAEWWKSQYTSTSDKVELLERWFGTVLDDNRVHGVVFPLYATSQTAIGELTDDSAGLSCTPSTSKVAGADPFAHLPQFWCLEVSAEKKEDGSHEIYYVEHIDDIAKVRSGEHLTWVLQKNTYTKEWDEDGYRYLKMQCRPATGYKSWPEGTNKAGRVYAYYAHPKYYAGLYSEGKPTCGTNLAPLIRKSHTDGVMLWNNRGKHYSGASGDLIRWLDRMMRLKYARKGNSGTIEGCTSYDYQYMAKVAETGVERILIALTEAANLLVGSAVQIGNELDDGIGSEDGDTASNYAKVNEKLITKIEEVEVDGTTYAAIYVDNDGKTFDTTAGVTMISTEPYWSGWNDDVLGTDGSKFNYTNGKEPGLIQKVEFMNGSYIIISDQLWQWSKDEDENFLFDCYVCHDQNKVYGSVITADYVKQEDLTMKFPSTQDSAWLYIEDTAISKDTSVEWPLGVRAGGSGVGCKAGFSCVPAASGVSAAWCFGISYSGGSVGVACRISHAPVGFASPLASLGSPGLAG